MRGDRSSDAPNFTRVLYVTNAANDQWFIPGNNQESSTDGGILTVDTITASADGSRTPGVYEVTPTNAANGQASVGSGCRLRVQVQSAANGTAGTVALDNISIIDPGQDYLVGNELTITDAMLGGGGGANITVDVASIMSADDDGPDNPDKGSMAMRLQDCRNLVGYTDAADPSTSQIGVAVQPGTLDTW